MINCIGTLQGTSGYASHFRGVVNELNKLVDCKIVTNLIQGFEREVNDKELEMLKREQDFDINLIITHPLHWRNNCSAKRNWVYLIWEGDRVPKWIFQECMNKNIEKIIVPSEHTKLAIENTLEKIKEEVGIKESDKVEYISHTSIINKVVVIPHGHNPEDFYPINTLHIQNKSTFNKPFKFLANKGLRNLEDRGGLQYLINAYLEEFDGTDTELILKINAAYGTPNLLEMFPKLMNRKDVRVIVNNLSTKELNELYNSCDVFVSPTRSEAFNIPCLEAMACGKPVITTNFGGQTDFCTNETGWLIDYDLVEVKHEIEYEGVKWATPKHDDLKTSLRNAFIEHSENINLCKMKSNNCLETAKKLTWTNTAKQIHSLL